MVNRICGKILKLISFLLLLFLSFISFSQDKGKLDKKGEHFLQKSKYGEIISYMESSDSLLNKEHPLYNYYLGMAYYYSPEMKSHATIYLEKYINSSDSAQIEYYGHYYVYYMLAKMYHLSYSFDEAENMYLRFIASIRQSEYLLEKEINEMITDAERQIEHCKFGKILIKNPRNVVIDNLGDSINTKYPEYAGVVSQDETMLIFTSRRPDTEGGKKTRDGFYEDIYKAYLIKGSLFDRTTLVPESTTSQYFNLVTDFAYANFQRMNAEINSGDHDGSIQLNHDDNILYFYRNSDIWSVVITADTNVKAEKMGTFINSAFYEPSIFFSYDETKLFIVSDRPGGYGGLDLYVSQLTDANTWSAPKNLGPTINTAFDEDAPYFDPDGVTLYFSSKGHSSMGEYDIFRTTLQDTVWADAVNMGFPINTPADDIYFTMTSRYNRGYYSSGNLSGKGDLDLYRITFSDERDPVAELMGFVKRGDQLLPAHAKITLTASEGSESISDETDTINGDYFLLMGHGKTYHMLVETDEFAPYQRDFFVPEQKEYFQLYQEIHHVHLYNDKGEIIGQQITVFNALGEVNSKTVYYNEDITESLNKIKSDNKLEGDLTAISEIRFYITEDSLRKLMISDSTLNFDLYDDVTIFFLNDPGADVFDPNSYSAYQGSTKRDDFINKDIVEIEKYNSPEGTTNVAGFSGLFFTVQIGVYSKDVNHSVFFNLDSIVTEKLPENLFRYSTGLFNSVTAANIRRDKIVQIGIKDAFVTAYYNGERILLSEAEKLLDIYGSKILYLH